MHSKDYIMRLIEQLGRFLIALRRSILSGELTGMQVQDRLREAADKVGFDLTLARAADPGTIQLLVAPLGEVEPARCWMVAEVLMLDGMQAEAEGRAGDAAAAFEKALPLYRLLEPGALHLGLPEAVERIERLEEGLLRLADGRESGLLEPGEDPEAS